MKAIVIILSIIIFSACLFIGIQAGSSSNPLPFLQSTPETSALPPKNQRSIVIAGVDDLSAQNPRLVSVWVTFFRPGSNRVSALALYPNNRSVTGSSQDLAASFNLTSEKKISPEFGRALQAYDFSWNAIVVIDRTGTAAMIDWLGGVEQAGVRLDGASAAAILVEPWTDPAAALRSQTDLGKSLCAAASRETNLDWPGLLALISPDHLITDIDLEPLTREFADLFNTGKPFTCELAADVE